MERNEEREQKLMEYLYGEIPPLERPSFQKDLEADPELKRDLLNFIQLRHLTQDHLPDQKAPGHLVKKVLNQLGIRRPWYQAWTEGFFRPALVGAFVLAMTLGIAYQIRHWGTETVNVAQKTPEIAVTTMPDSGENEKRFEDMFLAKAPSSYDLQVPVRRSSPWISSGSPNGRVSLVGYGSPEAIRPEKNIPSAEIYNLELQAQQEVARFMHHQALRMRAMGEYEAAAKHLANLIATYPFYQFKLQAMAQRVDCLFQAGQSEVAKVELKVLRELSPQLAMVVEQHWGL